MKHKQTYVIQEGIRQEAWRTIARGMRLFDAKMVTHNLNANFTFDGEQIWCFRVRKETRGK